MRILRPDGTCLFEAAGDGPYLLGRGDDAEIRLNDPSVSRAHARLLRAGGQWRLTDLESAAGVAVNGQSASQVVLKHEDVVDLGDSRLVIDLPAAAARPAAPVVESAESEDAVASAAYPAWMKRYGAVAVVVALVFVARPLWAPDSEAARTAFRQGVDAEARLDFAEAARRFREVETGDARSALKREAGARRTVVESLSARRSEAEMKLDAVVADSAGGGFGEVERKLRSTARSYLDVLPLDALEHRVTAARSASRERSASMLRRAEADVAARIESGWFGEAERAARELGASPALSSEDAASAEAIVAKAEGAARHAIVALGAEGAALAPDAFMTRLRRELPLFRGSVAEEDLRRRLADAEAEERTLAARRGAPRRPVVEEAPPEAPKPAPDAGDLRGTAEAAWAVRDYAKAAEQFAKLGDSARADRAAVLAAFKTRVTEALNADRARFRGLKFGGELTASLGRVDADVLEFDISGGARFRIPWAKLDPSRFMPILERLTLTADEERSLGTWWLATGEPECALAALARAATADAGWAPKQAGLIAEARGIAPPEDGFAFYRGAFLTKDEETEAKFADTLRTVSDELAAAPAGAFEGPLGRLKDMGPRGIAAATTGLQDRMEQNCARVAALPFLRAGGLEALRAKLFQELEVRRAAAFALIFDEKRYPYPYAPNQAEVQGEVDRLTDLVRDVWERPSKLVVAGVGGAKPDPAAAALSALDADQRAVAAASKELGAEMPADAVEAVVGRLISMPTYAPDGRTRSLLDDSKEIEAYNLTQTAVIGEFEREVHRITNAYRLMMGRRSVMIDDRLVNAARGHSEEMSRLKYFAHDSPTPGRKGPSDRTRLTGWGGGVSENIARGSPTPAGAVNGWIGSSGHHRNILGTGHTHLGVGYAKDGNFWTQNFGKANPKPPKR